MLLRRLALVAGSAFALIFACFGFTSPASAQSPAALAGQVTSAEEGAMEGVIVSAKKDGSTITVSVISNAQGRYSFPASRLDGGRYTLQIRAAGYDLATINLSSSMKHEFELKTLPRVKGRGTNVVITEYDLPRPTIEPHDVIIVNGEAWYTNFGEQFLGKIDPKTGKHTEYAMPELR